MDERVVINEKLTWTTASMEADEEVALNPNKYRLPSDRTKYARPLAVNKRRIIAGSNGLSISDTKAVFK